MTHQVNTYCRICEALCGMTATVDGDELIALRPNKNHPISQGFSCPKGIAMTAIVNDPDRLLYPMRRRAGVPRGQGGIEQFERITWEQAFAEIEDIERIAGMTLLDGIPVASNPSWSARRIRARG